MYNFEIERPSTIADAVSGLSSDGAQALAGGQTLIPILKLRLASPNKLVSLTSIPDMQGISTDGDGRVCIGGATTHAAVVAGDPRSPETIVVPARNDDTGWKTEEVLQVEENWGVEEYFAGASGDRLVGRQFHRIGVGACGR